MRVVRSDDHRLHQPKELYGGVFVPPFECPQRWDHVMARLNQRGFTDQAEPEPLDPATVARVHDPGFVEFLRTAWDRWRSEGYEGDVIASVFPARRMTQRRPEHIDGVVGYYALATETAITAGTWRAVEASAAIAQTAQRHVSAGAASAFALCRPPGHHAAADLYGGYCFLNNAAIAAQGFLDDGAERVAVLDPDFHHGNGTQDIFYARDDVLFCSLHGAPEQAFPHFSGYADETGVGPGEGFTVNYPMPPGTGYDRWSEALDDALARIRAFGPDALVVSLGVDTFVDDPISFFRLASDDFSDYGRRIGALGVPTVFCMEGGYAVDEIGTNTVNVLEGFLS